MSVEFDDHEAGDSLDKYFPMYTSESPSYESPSLREGK